MVGDAALNKEKMFKQNLRWKYSFLSLSAIVIAITSLAFFTHDQAWLFLGFAGTALSIVLSVIAIVITLVDVAGQKQQVVDITNSATELKEIVEQLKLENKDYKNAMDSLINDNMQSQFSSFEKRVSLVIDQLPDEQRNEVKEEIDNFANNIKKYNKKSISQFNNFSVFVPISHEINIDDLSHLHNTLINMGINVKTFVETSKKNIKGIEVFFSLNENIKSEKKLEEYFKQELIIKNLTEKILG